MTDLAFPNISGVSRETIQTAIENEFECNRCGHCCKGDGLVEVGSAEVARMSEYLGLTRKQFLAQYTRPGRPGHYWLIDQKNEEKWCIFLFMDETGKYGCQVNPAKPDQCGTFPAEWRNPDSFRTCSGLRKLVRTLRKSVAGDSTGETKVD